MSLHKLANSDNLGRYYISKFSMVLHYTFALLRKAVMIVAYSLGACKISIHMKILLQKG